MYSILYLRKVPCGKDADECIFKVVTNSQNFLLEIEDVEKSRVKFTNSKTQQITKRCAKSKVNSSSTSKYADRSMGNIDQLKVQLETKLNEESNESDCEPNSQMNSLMSSFISRLNAIDDKIPAGFNDQDYELTEKYQKLNEIQMPVFVTKNNHKLED